MLEKMHAHTSRFLTPTPHFLDVVLLDVQHNCLTPMSAQLILKRAVPKLFAIPSGPFQCLW